ncbi:MAG: 23S rRNA (uracil(1939)-C(5))-methyltransferase RlmD [bacterium]|jgi:23S rRNA (uracil1939-C5)-methyltransferase
MRKQKYRVIEGVSVTGYAAEGRSLARLDGKVLFIEGAVPGDVVDVAVTRSKKDWAEGRVLRFHAYSEDRVAAFCAHFGVCGGCKWQMLPYERQLVYKRQEVEDNLRRIGRIELPEVRQILGAEATRGYRNKLEFTFSSKRYLTDEEMRGVSPEERDVLKSRSALGFHVPKLFDKIVDIETCHLQAGPVNDIRNWIRTEALARGHAFYDIRAHSGWLRNLVFRQCETGELMVNLVIAAPDPEERDRLLRDLHAAFPMIDSLYYTVNAKMNDSLHDLTPVLFAGNPFVTERLGELSFRIGPKSFFQTNTRQAERLYAQTKILAGLTGRETVYDLYCGTGSIGLFVSDMAAKVIGVEVIAAAVDDARENARINGIGHAEFFAGDVIDVCDDSFFERHGRPDVIITDPPRAGMHEQLVRKILEIRAPRVVYVSCNPATQARDLQLLDAAYAVTAVQPVDMFPHTHHIENIAQLTLKNL